MSINNITNADFVRSPEAFYRIAKLGQAHESLTLDFKKDINGYQPRGIDTSTQQRELCRDITQFANKFGGCLLLGVEEKLNGAKKVASSVYPLSDFDGRRQWIEQAVQNYVIPSTISFEIVPIHLPEGLVIAINVPAHEQLVWIWDRSSKTMQCVRRTNHGKEYLNPDEAEEHLMDSSRARKLALHRVLSTVERKEVQLASGVWTVANGGSIGSSALLRMPAVILLGRSNDYEFELCVQTQHLRGMVSVNIPYGLISETWITSEGSIGLLLKVRLVTGQSKDHITMEPQ